MSRRGRAGVMALTLLLALPAWGSTTGAVPLLSGELRAQGAASAGERSDALRSSASEVAAHWSRGNASGLADLLSPQGIGFHTPTEGRAALDRRMAVAALDDLLNRSSSVSCTVVRVTLASGASDRGSAELAWEAMAPGTSEVTRRTVFVGFAWEGNRWTIYEIRILPA